MFKTNRTFNILTFQNLMTRLFDLSLIQDTIQALCAGKGTLEFWQDRGDIIKGLGVLVDIIEEGHQLTDSKMRSRNNAYSTKSSHYCINQGIHKASGRVDSWGIKDSGLGIIGIAFIRPFKSLTELILSIKGLDQTFLGQRLFDQLSLKTTRLGLLLEKRIRTLGNKTSNHKG